MHDVSSHNCVDHTLHQYRAAYNSTCNVVYALLPTYCLLAVILNLPYVLPLCDLFNLIVILSEWDIDGDGFLLQWTKDEAFRKCQNEL